MIKIKIVSVGKLKERFFLDAAAEYEKRLSGLCNFEAVEISPEKISENPTEKEIYNCLKREAAAIEKKISKTAIIKEKVDPSVIGGIRLQAQGVQYDDTVAYHLDSLSKLLSN